MISGGKKGAALRRFAALESARTRLGEERDLLEQGQEQPGDALLEVVGHHRLGQDARAARMWGRECMLELARCLTCEVLM